ncbi:hypothetical protein [Marinobacter lipolyticus]|uniref:hypothetical protein n=1 Tax=Marinobacter lipolyticus TaxID=209639 RepID=UPI0011A96758|nr:hypothetical protein [Marinobacter lipolyticus]
MRVVDVEKNRLPGGTAFTFDSPDASDRSVYSKPSVCTTEIPVLGDEQWGTKTKKNPGNNKNNADRQRFQGGFVRTDPPFDYLDLENPAFHSGLNISCPLFPSIRLQTCANPVQTVKLSFFAHAITEFNA